MNVAGSNPAEGTGRIMKQYDIVIATPASMIHASYVRSLVKTIKAFEERGISWNFINYESCYIAGARERIINDSDAAILSATVPFSGKFDYKKIMWIDSDIEWKPEHILSLYYSDRDIVSGAYMMTNGKVAVSFDGVENPFPHQIPTAREVELTTCGFGFVCIKRGVFEKIESPWFESYAFELDGRLRSYLGEDTSWCLRAKEAGFKIWLDPSVRVLHNKTMTLAWID